MPVNRPRGFLDTLEQRPRGLQLVLWLLLSLAFALFLAIYSIQPSLNRPYIIQDDARQHVFWMERLSDTEAFPDDLIADYYQSIAPTGYVYFYKLASKIGIHPISFSKIVPVLLGVITSLYCFFAAVELLPVPFAAFFSTVLLNQAMWARDDLVSATPRAFLYPLFAAFIFYLLRRNTVRTLVAFALQGLFYPSIMMVSAGILALGMIKVRRFRPALSLNRQDYVLAAGGVIIGVAVLIQYALKSAGHGDVMTASEARSMPEFAPDGRISYFLPDKLEFWLTAPLSGLMPGAFPVFIWLSLLLPVMHKYPARFPLAQKLGSQANLLSRTLAVSVALFAAAHVLLFRLYLPSRYTQHTFRIVMSLAAGAALAILIDAALGSARNRALVYAAIAAVTLGLIATTLLLPDVPQRRFKVGKDVALYDFLRTKPKDAVVATLGQEASNIPSFAARSVLAGREYAMPFHKGYYAEFRQRNLDLIEAQYTTDRHRLAGFIMKYKIAFILVERDAFHPDYLLKNRYLRQFDPAVSEAIAALKRGDVPLLSTLLESCAVLKDGGFVLLDAERVLARAALTH